MSDVKRISDQIHDAIKDSIAKAKLVDSGNGFDLNDIRAVLNTIDTVLTEVERLSKDVSVGLLSGKDKKDIAVDVLSRLVDFDIPWVPDFLEKTLKAKAIDFAIDYSVEFLNKKLGKEWLR